MSERMNINVGLLGHVDSGKTSLARALSTQASTASFDKNPQSTERGITLDLGFSSFMLPSPPEIAEKTKELQFTLVDCPGHASLIRTIIGGAHIIDLMILVVDVNKGIQTQTAECIVIGQLTTRFMIVALNKVDTLAESQKDKVITRVTKRVQGALAATHFKNAPIVTISANPSTGDSTGLDVLQSTLLEMTLRIPKLQRMLESSSPEPVGSTDPFRFAIDHCFSVKGQGTVLTGTVLSGRVQVNDTIELPELKIERKVKSMQMFRQPVTNAVEGDRIGICVTQLNAKLIERGVAGHPGAYIQTKGVIVSAEKIPFFKGSIKSKALMHISIGHATVMATVQVFCRPQPAETTEQKFDFAEEYLYADELYPTNEEHPAGSQFILLSFEKVVTCANQAMVIGSKLDTDIHSNVCRLAFSGHLEAILDPTLPEELKRLRIYKPCERVGVVDRAVDDQRVIGNKLFKKETNMSLFIGLSVVRTSNDAVGKIESSFGKSGKFKVYFPEGGQSGTDGKLVLHYKKYIYDRTKKITQ